MLKLEFTAGKEQKRAPRIVRMGLVQHSIVLPTNVSVQDQVSISFFCH
jgi:hypothetical protein